MVAVVEAEGGGEEVQEGVAAAAAMAGTNGETSKGRRPRTFSSDSF